MMGNNVINFDTMGDERGSLISLEVNRNIPFAIKRVYYIFNTKPGVSRGFHAHKNLQQVLVCLKGSCTVLLDDGKSKKKYQLKKANQGLFVDGVVWREMHDFSEDCVLLVLASDFYDEGDYIRDYEDFQKTIKEREE